MKAIKRKEKKIIKAFLEVIKKNGILRNYIRCSVFQLVCCDANVWHESDPGEVPEILN